MAKKNKKSKVVENGALSDFDGTVLNYIGVGILELLVLVLMGGIGAGAMLLLGTDNVISIVVLVVCVLIGLSWMTVIFMKWDAKHTIINGQRLKFKASAINFLLNYLKWVLLIVITLGIYSLWLPVKVRKWRARHTTSSPVQSVYNSQPNITFNTY